ncbi:ANK [Seminavis robusta]|uniref:ANK n=1 Tax=Seminavis robusta TaxID=568900 RepID=A0A9N8H5K4_9STRA|nr:ANK [Seminavis robusta]|eukprot:Sro76_g041630.1 ANK (403) ;mRNA; r:59405-60613
MKRRLGEGVGGKATKVQRIMSSLPDRMLHKANAIQEARPDNTIKEHTGVDLEFPSYAALTDFFHAPTQAEIDAYQHDILAAVRSSKIDTLREFHAAGRPMKCSNEFGESILHLACRKGLVQVAKFLIQEAGVPVQVCDDYGRNPLHDACWVHKPNFELMDMVLSKCPDLLFIKDRRGHTPLSFARRDQWKSWNDYLKSKSPEFLKPKKLLERSSDSSSSSKTTNTPSTVVAATAPSTPVVAAKRFSAGAIASKGISLPSFKLQVAAKGICLPGFTDVAVVKKSPSEAKIATGGGVKLPSAGITLPSSGVKLPVPTASPVLKGPPTTTTNHPGAPKEAPVLPLTPANTPATGMPAMIRLPNGTVVALPSIAAVSKTGINVLLQAASSAKSPSPTKQNPTATAG